MDAGIDVIAVEICDKDSVDIVELTISDELLELSKVEVVPSETIEDGSKDGIESALAQEITKGDSSVTNNRKRLFMA